MLFKMMFYDDQRI